MVGPISRMSGTSCPAKWRGSTWLLNRIGRFKEDLKRRTSLSIHIVHAIIAYPTDIGIKNKKVPTL